MSEQRERFEVWAKTKNFPLTETKITGVGVTYKYATTEAAWHGYQAACPEGWQAVPKEQTRHMAYAVEDTDLPGFCTSSRQSRHHDLGRQIYEANLSAAPKPGDA